MQLHRLKWAGCLAYVEGKKNVYRVFVGTPKGKRLTKRLRHRWEDILMDH
jgi:guanylate kinase